MSDDPTAPGAAEAAADDPQGDGQHVDDLAFGPSGYLPPKASARARKIVLRAPLGIQWVVASLVAGLVVVAAGVVLLTRSSGPPGAPFEPTIAVADIDGAAALDGHDALAVAAGGPVRVYVAAADVAWCPASGRLESPDGAWSASSGRGFGVASLPRHPSEVHDGTLYVDFTSTVAGPAAATEPVEPAC